MISFKEHDQRAKSSATMEVSKNSHKICTIVVRVFAIESDVRRWEHNGGCGTNSMIVNLGKAPVIGVIRPGVGAGGNTLKYSVRHSPPGKGFVCTCGVAYDAGFHALGVGG